MLYVSDTLETAQSFAQLASDMLSVRPERCVCVRNRHASCLRCADACTSGAIAVADGALTISEDLCVGCGTCATVCPTCALEIRHPNDAALLSQVRKSAGYAHGSVTFACHRALEQGACDPQIADGIGLVCLSRLEESMLATLYAEGVDEVRAIRADCDSCPRHDGLKSARLVEQTMDVLERAWGLSATFKIVALDAAVGETGGNAHDLPRGPESLAGPGMQEQAMLAHVTPDGTLPHFVPVRRGRLLDALAHFGDPVVESLETRLWGHVEIDMAKCQSCRMCAVFCPTGALSRFEDEDGSIGIEHYVAECVHCCLCEDICPADAIVSHASVPALQLAHAEVERYPMPAPEWASGPDQIVRKMEKKISGNAVTASYSTEIPKKEMAGTQ